MGLAHPLRLISLVPRYALASAACQVHCGRQGHPVTPTGPAPSWLLNVGAPARGRAD